MKKLALVVAYLALAVSPLLANTQPVETFLSHAPNAFIVQFQSGTDVQAVANELVAAHPGVVLKYTYTSAILGMAITNTSQQDADAINADPRVIWTQQDVLGASTQATGVSPILPPGWALDRIDQTTLPLSRSYTEPAATGAGVTIYVLDTGINHDSSNAGMRNEFGTRVHDLWTLATKLDGSGNPVPDYGDITEGGGHGTAVAAIAAGRTLGVARSARIENVKVVIGTQAKASDVIKGIDEIRKHYLFQNPAWNRGTGCLSGFGTQHNPAVVNVSLAQPKNTLTDRAVTNSIAAGLVFVCAAGNSERTLNQTPVPHDASTVSPANLGSDTCTPALTVGATMLQSPYTEDRLVRTSVWASNWGAAVKIWAPGLDVNTVGGDGNPMVFQGTSAAAPYVTGEVARHLTAHIQPQAPASPSTIIQEVLAAATPGQLADTELSTAQNRLLFIEPLAGTPIARVPKADFDVDGRSDILWRNPVTGANAAWIMTPQLTILAIQNLPGLAISDYRIVGTDDFDGDTQPDLLWRNKTTGTTALWLMYGATVSMVVNLPSITDTHYYVGGVADFNRDGFPDILWHNDTTGATAIWLMSGTTFTGTIINLPTLTGSTIRFEGAADFNHDGSPDIVIRDYATGNNSLWIMNGVTMDHTESLPPLPNTAYVLGGLADFNRDGSTDMLWHNTTTGDLSNAIWLMNGTAYSSTVNLGVIPNPDYAIAGPR